jgi:hypothetical protein
MKLYVLALFFVAAIATSAQAGQLGSQAATVGEGGLSFSAGINYAIKDMKINGTKEEMTTRQLVLTGDYGLLPSLDLYIKLGFADMEIKGFRGRLDALYGVGAKFKLFKDPEDKLNVTIDGGVTRFNSGDSTTDATVTDYMGALIVSNKAGNMTPYGGIKVCETEVEGVVSTKYKADKKVGILAGVDYFVNPNVFFNGEVNLFDQQAVYVGAGFKF